MEPTFSGGLRGRIMAWCEKTYGSESMSFSQVVALMLPLLLDQFFLRLISLLNTSMVSSYGPEAASAVSSIDSFNLFLVNFFLAVATGCAVVVAQYCGRGDRHSANRASAQAVGASLLISVVIMAVILVFGREIIGLLLGKADPLIREYGLTFLTGSAISFPFYAVMQTILGAQRGAGNSRAVMVFSTIMNLTNVFGNFLLLKVFGMGVFGLSVSVVVSRVLAAVLAVVYMLKSNDELHFKPSHFFVPDVPLQKSIFYVALPTGFEQVFFYGGRMLTQVFVVGFGTMSSAAHGVATPFSNSLQVFGAAMLTGSVTLVGQAIGAGRPSEGKRYIKNITLTSIVLSAFTALLFFWLLGPFLSLYDLPPEAYEKARNVCLLNLVLTPVLWPISFSISNSLCAAGDARFISVVSMLCMWGIRVGGGYFMGNLLGFGLYGIWYAMMIEWAVRGVIFITRSRGDKWYRHKVI